MHKRFQEIHESSANWFATWRSFMWFYIGFYKWKWHIWNQTKISFAVSSHDISMDAESAIIGFTHSASFWIIYLIFISNIKKGVWEVGNGTWWFSYHFNLSCVFACGCLHACVSTCVPECVCIFYKIVFEIAMFMYSVFMITVHECSFRGPQGRLAMPTGQPSLN